MSSPSSADYAEQQLIAPVPLRRPERPSRAELPLPLTSFVGRERELATTVAVLRQDGIRLLTLAGPGGVGKTRLALRVAEEVANDFPDGVWFVPLALVHDPALVTDTVARLIGVGEVAGRSLMKGLQAFLRDKHVLLILDNFEHLLEAAPVVTDLLATCPHLSIMATSRTVLRLSGEHDLVVPPFAVPDLDRLPSLQEVKDVPAIRLFVERARAVRDGFAITAENAATVAKICQRLDGLPLAIELAAARSSHLPPDALLDRLDQRLSLLTGGPRDAPARLRTMRDAIVWSYDLLTTEEQVLFCRLAVFVGGFTIEAAEHMCQVKTEHGVAVDSILDGIASLVDKSLLWPLLDATRFGMLETIREFGLEKLAASGEEDAIREHHAESFLALAEEAEPRLSAPEQIAWLDRLETELPNIRAAHERLRDAEDTERGLRLAAALWTFWVVRDHVSEGRRWLEALLASEQTKSAGRLKALLALGDMAERQGDYLSAVAWTEEALDLARVRGDRLVEAAALRGLGNVAISRGALARHRLNDEALAEAEITKALAYLDQGVALARELGDEWGAAKALHWLASARWFSEDTANIAVCLEEAAAAYRRLGDLRQLCMVLASSGILAHSLGDLPQSRAAFAESLTLARRLRYWWWISICLAGLAAVEAADRECKRAARLLGAAAALREVTGEPLRWSDQVWHDQVIAVVRATLGESGFAAAWAAGAALSPDAAIAEALAEGPLELVVPQDPAAPAAHDPLTPREREVLRLLAEGRSDREVATALNISRRTAATHIANIYRKLDVNSRAAAAAYAVRKGLA